MIRAFFAALALACVVLFALLFVSVPGWTAGLHPACNVTMPCQPFASTRAPSSKALERRAARGRYLEGRLPFGSPIVPPETASSFLNAPSSFIRGRLVCARNVNAALAARGIKGTGSALAKSFLSWGAASGPVKGAVAVFSRGRGGHVAIVHDVRPDGTVIYLNPSSRRQAWQVGPYHRRPIAFRVAGHG